MRLIRSVCALSALMLLAFAPQMFAQNAPSLSIGILHPSDLKDILPGKVFFRGQSATTQERNSGGVRFTDGSMMLVALVDNSGYSSGVQEKYQAYLMTEVPLNFAGNTLPPGAYGVGILKAAGELKFVVMNLAAQDIFQTDAANDAKLHRPTPLQVLAGTGEGTYRLYLGRNFVEFSRGK